MISWEKLLREYNQGFGPGVLAVLGVVDQEFYSMPLTLPYDLAGYKSYCIVTGPGAHIALQLLSQQLDPVQRKKHGLDAIEQLSSFIKGYGAGSEISITKSDRLIYRVLHVPSIQPATDNRVIFCNSSGSCRLPDSTTGELIDPNS